MLRKDCANALLNLEADYLKAKSESLNASDLNLIAMASWCHSLSSRFRLLGRMFSCLGTKAISIIGSEVLPANRVKSFQKRVPCASFVSFLFFKVFPLVPFHGFISFSRCSRHFPCRLLKRSPLPGLKGLLQVKSAAMSLDSGTNPQPSLKDEDNKPVETGTLDQRPSFKDEDNRPVSAVLQKEICEMGEVDLVQTEL